MFDLIDKELKQYYITAHKYIFLIGLCLSFILIILSVFYTAASALLVIFAIITSAFFITWNINKRKYGKSISFIDGILTIYDYRNYKINEFKFEFLKKKYVNIAFDQYPRFSFKRCLVLYSDSEPYENMEYSSYWNDSSFVIIQKSETIDILINLD